ncbi:helix-turn-helix domain-containing protein [Parasphingorhabdus halotolerans]|uniref:Helix-turn-helix transcriptional regulator n=1 Tax=Parasphingorhabdus halotolerans TaxID=2725558 RepID=A0A6H2DH93_9SPHN|nr:helix-turn-helix transcriptional regulator [Parasphingorhabdus halotolerans]QJB68039.1 helix-turn-helix transcriptional regulator [Parasphingorhabdus halotolerans]
MNKNNSIDRIDNLSEPQKECLRLVASLRSSKEIARILDISPHTVDQRLKRAQTILGASSRAEAARMFVKHEKQHAAGDPKLYDDLVHQSSDLPRYRYARDEQASSGEWNPPNVRGQDEFRDEQAFFSHNVFQSAQNPSFLSVLLEAKRENNLSIPARAGLIVLIMMVGLLAFALLVNLAEGLSRLT